MPGGQQMVPNAHSIALHTKNMENCDSKGSMTVQNLIPKSLCNAMFIEKQYRHQFASSRTKCTLNRYRGVLCGNRKPNIQGTERHSRIFTKISSEKALSSLNTDDILCVLYVLQQRLRHVRPQLHDNHASILSPRSPIASPRGIRTTVRGERFINDKRKTLEAVN